MKIKGMIGVILVCLAGYFYVNYAEAQRSVPNSYFVEGEIDHGTVYSFLNKFGNACTVISNNRGSSISCVE